MGKNVYEVEGMAERNNGILKSKGGEIECQPKCLHKVLCERAVH